MDLHKLLLSVSVCAGICTYAGATQTKVTVVTKDDDIVEHTMDEFGKIYFDESNLLLEESEGSSPMQYALSNIRMVSFYEATGLSEAKMVHLSVYPNPAKEFIYVANVKKGDWLELFTVDGKLVKRGQYSSSKGFSLSELPNGVYVLVVNGQSIKITKE